MISIPLLGENTDWKRHSYHHHAECVRLRDLPMCCRKQISDNLCKCRTESVRWAIYLWPRNLKWNLYLLLFIHHLNLTFSCELEIAFPRNNGKYQLALYKMKGFNYFSILAVHWEPSLVVCQIQKGFNNYFSWVVLITEQWDAMGIFSATNVNVGISFQPHLHK